MRRQMIQSRRPSVHAMGVVLVRGRQMRIASSIGAALGFPVQWVWLVRIPGMPAHEHATWSEAVECALAHAPQPGMEPPC